jgi:hypothetical protein
VVLIHEALDFAQFMGSDASAPSQAHAIEPEFTLAIGSPNMNVRRLTAFIGIKMKSVCADAQNRRHCVTVLPWLIS